MVRFGLQRLLGYLLDGLGLVLQKQNSTIHIASGGSKILKKIVMLFTPFENWTRVQDQRVPSTYAYSWV